MTERKYRTPSRTAREKYSDEEGKELYGELGWLDCLLKAQTTHSSSRNLRRINRVEKHLKKKKERR